MANSGHYSPCLMKIGVAEDSPQAQRLVERLEKIMLKVRDDLELTGPILSDGVRKNPQFRTALLEKLQTETAQAQEDLENLRRMVLSPQILGAAETIAYVGIAREAGSLGENAAFVITENLKNLSWRDCMLGA